MHSFYLELEGCVCVTVVGSEVCVESAGLGGLNEMPSRIRDQNVSSLLRLPTLSSDQEAIL